MARSACCLFFRHPLPQGQTTTRGRDLESNECVDMRHLPRRTIAGRRDRTFAVASQRPALIGKTVETVVTENQMVKESDTQQVSRFP